MNNDWIECLHWLCVSILASPFGWEVGPLGLGGGEFACGVVWPCVVSAVLFAWCVGIGALVVGQSIFVSEFPPSVAYRRHLPPRGTAFSRAPASQSLGRVARLRGSLIMRASSPPSVRLTPATFPQGGRLFRGSCFAVAGVGGEVGGSLC